ncbi:hypothetical protein BGX23_002408 [Mortierella sp. AD031]|nr:hypothetical protein BGX23_002408 [Mortierella sp. AD031]
MKKQFIAIPELMAQLGLHLSPPDLLSCVQVNRAWNLALIPSLWRSIDNSTHSWPYILQHCTNLRPSTTTNITLQEHLPFFQQRDTTKDRDSDLNKDRDWILAVFEKYGRYIRELKIQWPLVLEAVSQAETCTGLQSLIMETGRYGEGPRLVEVHTVSDQPYESLFDEYGVARTTSPQLSEEALFPDHLTRTDVVLQPQYQHFTNESIQARASHDWIHTQHLWHLIRINPSLVRLDIININLHRFIDVSPDFFCSTIGSLKNLRKLNCLSPSFDLGFWRLWELLSPGIESLSINCDPFPLPNPLPEINPNLRSLATKRGTTTTNGLLTLLGTFPNLTNLELEAVIVNPDKSSHFISYCPLLLPPLPLGGQALRRLGTSYVDDWDALLHYLPSIVEWETQGMLDDDLALMLTRRCLEIESFRATFQPWYVWDRRETRPNHDPANRFLVAHQHLRVFDSIQNFIRVDEMLSQPWACMGLEWLTCRIVDVDRLSPEEERVVARVMAPGYSDKLSEEELVAVEKFNGCRAQHHGVYDRLASLTRLKHLDLGYENRYPWTFKTDNYYEAEDGKKYVCYDKPTFDTLELTLESGLGRLAALKDLEMFGFECVNHRIGRAELDWMAVSWPKLKLMYGLDRERLYGIEHSKERAVLREYFQELCPDVVHDSLFEDIV